MVFRKQKKIGLALGGGAARGIAHIGVIKGLEELGIKIDYIAGTSAGSIVGGIYAAGVPIDEMISVVKGLKWSAMAGFRVSRKGITSTAKLEKFIRDVVGDTKLTETKIPFCAMATNLLTGEPRPFFNEDVDLASAIRASANFPGVYTPFQFQGDYYIDGGASSNIPIRQVREMGADIVIAVDVIPKVKLDRMPSNIALLVDRGLDIILTKNGDQFLSEANFVLRPIQEYIHSFSIKKSNRLIGLGMACVAANRSHLKKWSYQ